MATGSIGNIKFDVIDNRTLRGNIDVVAPFVAPNIVQWYRVNTDAILDLPISVSENVAVYCCVIGHSANTAVRLIFVSGSNTQAQNILICKTRSTGNTWYYVNSTPF